ncbi:MAG: recombination protein NinG [Spirochaetales bacterium]|jgi:hypothetical protein|nr:recombination protein NinG [Spirochaetales bacterium]
MKRCKVCRKEFKPKFNTTQATCGTDCAIVHGREKQQEAHRKAFKKKTRDMKAKAKTRSKWLSEAQAACNAYIRERDKNDGCISCGTTKPDIQYCAGHYKTRGGFPELRFHPMNIHKQCNRNCNGAKSGNIAEYRPRLIEKIGLSNVEWLEGKQLAQNLSIDEIAEIKQFYKEQLKLLQKEKLL